MPEHKNNSKIKFTYLTANQQILTALSAIVILIVILYLNVLLLRPLLLIVFSHTKAVSFYKNTLLTLLQEEYHIL